MALLIITLTTQKIDDTLKLIWNYGGDNMKEVKVYGFAVANLAGTCGLPTFRQMRDTQKLLDYVKKLDGFLGVHPHPPEGTVLIFKTKQDAIRAQNLLKFDLELNAIGKHVVEIFIPEEYANG